MSLAKKKKLILKMEERQCVQYSARQCVQYSLSRSGEVLEGRGSRALPNPSLRSWGNFLFLERFYCSCFWYWGFSNKVFLKKIKSLNKVPKKIENCGDFRWIGPLKSFNLRRFFRWVLGSRGGGGTCPKCPPPLFGYAPGNVEVKRGRFSSKWKLVACMTSRP